MDDTRSRLIRCFRAVFPGLKENKIPKASSASVPGWDSVATVTLLAAVEEEFGVEFAPEQMGELTTFDSILEWLEQARQA